ncbi:MAG TPA: DEAD/DEAH box helicase [Ktedonobacteraceae bacterium]|nr:DEAD/DEAH box helicase [Ktedonobacteraceae bacterium]
MIVLHAIWDYRTGGQLHIWAESSTLATATPRSEKQTGKKPRPHPFILPSDALKEEMGKLAGSLLAASASTGMLTLRLPSTARKPLSSPELIVEREAGAQPTGLQPWEVETLVLEPDAALDFLLALPAEAPHGVAFGSSLRFWREAANLAFALISKQSYAPVLQEQGKNGSLTVRAAWEAVLTGDDDERLRLLAQTMPPLCWAFAAPGEVKASSLLEIVQHFLNRSVDAFVRESLSVTGLLPARRGRSKGASLPEQWLHALSSEDVTLTASPKELKSFAAALHSWFDQLRPTEVNAPFRTCFRLNPPEESAQGEGNVEHGDNAEDGENKTWQLSFHLQANDDRSLLVPAENIWQERSSTLTFLKRKFENPQERLLADLGKASRLFPSLEESLTTARPSDLKLSTEQAYAFLRESAPLLEQSGFGVLVPAWWQKPAARLGVKLKLKANADANVSSGLMGLESVISYDWTVAIGDTTLTAREFEKLVRLKMPLVKVRGQWVELRPDEIEAAIAFFRKKRANGNISMGEALRLGLGQEISELGLPIIDVEGEGWVQDMLDRLSNPASLSLIETPSTFHGQLRPYQRKGVSWLAFLKQFGFGACLADDMGLGKTLEMIGLLLHEREAMLHAPALVICPMSIVGNWQRELQRFAPSLKVMVHHGHERLTGEAFIEEAKRHDVVITTYALALRDKEHLLPIEWEFVVVDEAQNIKNEAAKQTHAIKSLNAKYRVALTGTPVENRLSELWSIMEFLNPGYLGNGTAFRKQFALPIEKYHDAQKAEALKRLIQPFVLRRLKTDKAIIQDLPDKMEMKVFCNLTQEQATLYEATVQEMMERIEQAVGMERRGLVLAALMRLKQICNHPAHFIGDGSRLPDRSGKLARLEEMLEEVLAVGEKALIFTQFAEMGAMLRSYLQEAFGCEVLFLHGGTNKKQRDLMVQRFQEERRGPPIFILSLKAGGVGLNLTGANHVFHFDRWWNPAVENQATDRAFRIGQKKNVQVHKFVSTGTLEERIDQMIEQKKELAESIIGSGENWLTELSTAQLKELFALSREAVGE